MRKVEDILVEIQLGFSRQKRFDMVNYVSILPLFTNMDKL